MALSIFQSLHLHRYDDGCWVPNVFMRWTTRAGERLRADLPILPCFLSVCRCDILVRDEWVHHCQRAARSLTREDFELLKTVGKGQWGKVFLAKKASGPKAGLSIADQGAAAIESDTEVRWPFGWSLLSLLTYRLQCIEKQMLPPEYYKQ